MKDDDDEMAKAGSEAGTEVKFGSEQRASSKRISRKSKSIRGRALGFIFEVLGVEKSILALGRGEEVAAAASILPRIGFSNFSFLLVFGHFDRILFRTIFAGAFVLNWGWTLFWGALASSGHSSSLSISRANRSRSASLAT